MPKLKSQNPKPYDNTEDELIMVTPAVLENKLRDFDERAKIRPLIENTVLAITLLIPVVTGTFNDSPYFRGTTIRGIFIAGLIFVVIKIVYQLYRIRGGIHTKTEFIDSLRKEENKR